MQPYLECDGRVTARYCSVVLDGKVYSKKAERKRILNGETDSLSSRARTVHTRETIPYSATIMLLSLIHI